MRVLAIFLMVSAAVWVAATLPFEMIRMKHHRLIDAIQQKQEVTLSTISMAIEDHTALDGLPLCHRHFFKDLAVLRMAKFQKLEGKESLQQGDTILAKALESIEQHLHCQPKDGNGWLSKAMVHLYRAGFNEQVLAAYKQSAKHAPREGWLAEKRTLAFLGFFSLLDEEGQAIALNDIRVLQQASPVRRRRVRKALEVDSIDTLLFMAERLTHEATQ